jgi:hypothetical protein
MKRARALVAGLGLAVAVGCGFSTPQKVQERDPPGGQDRGPDVHNRAVDDLRTVEITVAAKRFQPQQASVALDSTVRLVNQTKRPVKLRFIKRVGRPLGDMTLEPGEHLEREYVRGGVETLGMKGSRAQLEVNVFPSP